MRFPPHKTAGACAGDQILRDAAQRLQLPRQVWNQCDELGFASPIPIWLPSPKATWADQQITARLKI